MEEKKIIRLIRASNGADKLHFSRVFFSNDESSVFFTPERKRLSGDKQKQWTENRGKRRKNILNFRYEYSHQWHLDEYHDRCCCSHRQFC